MYHALCHNTMMPKSFFCEWKKNPPQLPSLSLFLCTRITKWQASRIRINRCVIFSTRNHPTVWCDFSLPHSRQGVNLIGSWNQATQWIQALFYHHVTSTLISENNFLYNNFAFYILRNCIVNRCDKNEIFSFSLSLEANATQKAPQRKFAAAVAANAFP